MKLFCPPAGGGELPLPHSDSTPPSACALLRRRDNPTLNKDRYDMKDHVYVKQTKINVPVETLFRWHTENDAVLRLTPPWVRLEPVHRSGDGIGKGVTVQFRLRVLGMPLTWESEHVQYRENNLFTDVQTKGPFTKWEHTHRFIPMADGDSTTMEDSIVFKLPFGLLSRPFYGIFRKKLERIFTYRHRVLKQDLEQYAFRTKRKRVLVSGASGTIGRMLVPFLRTCGHEVVRLVRKKGNLLPDEVAWDPYSGVLDLEAAGPVDAVINLNGADISKGRWTEKQKKRIIDSRVIPTRVLAEKISRLDRRPDVFLSASAVGFYGKGGEHILTEADPEGDFFISEVCSRWETASEAARQAGVRTVHLRTGIVLTPAGGALAKMLPPFRAGMGIVFAPGSQYMSWISVDDEIAAILFALENDSVSGPVNLTAPSPVTNRAFSKTLAGVFSKRVFLRMPRFMTKLIWGEMGKETLVASVRAEPRKLKDHGFSFRHTDLSGALRDVLGYH